MRGTWGKYAWMNLKLCKVDFAVIILTMLLAMVTAYWGIWGTTFIVLVGFGGCAGVINKLLIKTLYEEKAYFYQSLPISMTATVIIKTIICSAAIFAEMLACRLREITEETTLPLFVLSTLLLAVMMTSLIFITISIVYGDLKERKNEVKFILLPIVLIVMIAAVYLGSWFMAGLEPAMRELLLIGASLIFGGMAFITNLLIMNRKYEI